MVLLSAFGLILYGQTLSYGFVLDDYLFITGNIFTKQGFAGIPDIWTHDVFTGVYGESLNRYRPLSATMFAIEYQLFPMNPFVGHFVGLVLYVLTAWLIARIVRDFAPKGWEWISVAAALLFLAHPLHTEVVANIKSRDEILSLLFSLLALRQSFKPGKAALWLSGLCFFLAMTAKESAITFLAVIPAAHYFFQSGPNTRWYRSIPPMLVAAGLYMAMRLSFVGFADVASQESDVMFNPYLLATPGQHWASLFANTGRYLRMLVYPHPLAFDYSYNQIPYSEWSQAAPWLTLLVTGGLTWFALKHWKKRHWLSFCIFAFFATFSVASNFVINTGTPLADRFLYTPSVAFCLAVGWLLNRWSETKGSAASRNVVLALLLVAGTAKTVTRNPAWKSNLSLYETDSKTSSQSALVRMFYGLELMNRSDGGKDRAMMGQAIQELTAATQINPRFHHAWYNLGMAYQKAGMHEQAVQCFQNVLKLQPTHINTHYSIALSLGNGLGKPAEALPYLERLVYEFHSTESDHLCGLGILYAMMGKYDQAIRVLESGVQQHPNDANLNFNLAITYANSGQQEKAQPYFQKAFALDPSLQQKTVPPR
ncbi:MAG: tetratricopeptide repeat protein [Flavobacteriales bacterium]|nr:tetratricopeptide repeat protein [Flavobacteriales bacterium]MCB9448799.1 tetratricopeptide repeat protein [Flavobacteriales bacterium]